MTPICAWLYYLFFALPFWTPYQAWRWRQRHGDEWWRSVWIAIGMAKARAFLRIEWDTIELRRRELPERKSDEGQ